MSSEKMRIFHIHSTDGGGGGGLVAYHLMEDYIKLGIDSRLYVGTTKLSSNSQVKFLFRKTDLAYKFSKILSYIHTIPIKLEIAIMIGSINLTSLKPIAHLLTGKEYSNIYNTKRDLKKLIALNPDIIHCHNLHSNYFDLSALIYLSQQVPVVITLHDAWMITGHCAHFFDCMKWKTGCGNCPNLSVYPKIRKDATACNWDKRKEIYQQCKLYVVGPSKWVLDCAEESILNAGIVKSKVIPNGIDLSIFCPGNKTAARDELNLPVDRYIICFSASGLKKSAFKDYLTLQKSLEILAEKKIDVLCVALGDTGETKFIGSSVEIRFIPFISDAHIVARYYRAADVYVHPAKADTFPTSVIEAEACGTPVVASAVCGIPEQIVDCETGFLVPSGDAELFAHRICELKDNEMLRKSMGKRAAELAKERYDDKIMVRRYIEFYQEILAKKDSLY